MRKSSRTVHNAASSSPQEPPSKPADPQKSVFPLPASDDVQEALQAIAHSRQYEAGQTLFWEDDPADFCYLLVAGAVKGYKLLPNGRSQIARFVVPGDLMGYSSFGTFTYTAEALVPSQVLHLPRPQFKAIVEKDPVLRQAVSRLIAAELHQTQRQILLLGRMPAVERVSQFLLDFAQRLHPDQEEMNPELVVELPMTRSDIADYLGLTIETVSRVFSKFRKDGLIELPKPNLVRFCDPTRFERQAAALAA